MEKVTKVLVVGSGGREHALALKLLQSPSVTEVIVAPGNAGTTTAPSGSGKTLRNSPEPPLGLALREKVDLVVVGPEVPLCEGLVDELTEAGILAYGPSKLAAELEGSKAFMKSFAARHGIPTARYRVCENAVSAHAVVASGELGFPVVVKADGLAAGKGVVVAPDLESASRAVRAAMEDRQFGDAGSRIVLEECLTGPEVSFFAICDGTRAEALMSAQDHKRVFDGDEGPNTGGMGAFAPSPLVDAAMESQIMKEIVDPVVAGRRH